MVDPPYSSKTFLLELHVVAMFIRCPGDAPHVLIEFQLPPGPGSTAMVVTLMLVVAVAVLWVVVLVVVLVMQLAGTKGPELPKSQRSE